MNIRRARGEGETEGGNCDGCEGRKWPHERKSKRRIEQENGELVTSIQMMGEGG